MFIKANLSLNDVCAMNYKFSDQNCDILINNLC